MISMKPAPKPVPELDYEAPDAVWSIILGKASLAESPSPSEWDYCQAIAELAARVETLEQLIITMVEKPEKEDSENNGEPGNE